MSNATKYSAVVLVALVALCVIAVLAAASMSSGGHGRCFPAASWGPANRELLPCVEVVRVEEDGSFIYRVSDADGTERYTSGIGALDR